MKSLKNKRKEESIFKIKIFDAKNNEKLNVDLLGKDTLVFDEKENEELKKKIESLEKYTYEEGDLIQIISLDSKKVFDIKGDILGDITKEKEDYSDGVDNEDYIKNVRFKISQGSLEGVYNKEPVFEGLTDIEVSDINAIDYLEGVKVTDDHDGMLNTRFKITELGLDDHYNSAPEIDGLEKGRVLINSDFDEREGVTATDIDEDEALTNNIIVEDMDTSTLGVKRITYTVSDSLGRTTTEEREVEVVPSYTANIRGFLDKSGNTVMSFRVNDLGSGFEFVSRNNIPFDSESADDIIFKLNVFNENGEKIKELPILGKETGDDEKFNKISEVSILKGYTFSVWTEHHERVKISGDMIKDKEIKEDYNDGIDNRDFIDNVRFGVAGNDLKANYNKAPTLDIPNEPFEMYLGEVVDLTKDITINDDRDTLSKENIKVTANLDAVGQTTATLVVTDSWGRKSQEYNRSINIKKGLERHELIFSKLVMKPGTPENDENHYITTPGMKLKFNADNRTLIAEKLAEGGFYPTIEILMFTIEIFNSDGSSKYKSTVKHQPISDVVNAFNNQPFKYGDYIKLSFTHDSTLAIKGQVINAQQVYDPYVKISYDLEKTKFVITEKGLEAQYDDNYKDPDRQNTITFYEAFAGNMAFRLKINPSVDNPNGGRITTEVNPNPSLYLDNNNRNNDTIFSLKIVKKNGNSQLYTARGRQKPASYANNWNGKEFEYGDYLMFEDLDRHPKNLRISGNIRTGIKGQELEDYADGIDDVNALLNTRFYLTRDGIVAVRNDGVRFTGVEDANIIVGTSFDERMGVEAFSNIDGVVTENILVDNEVNENEINSHTVTYRLVDSWGKTTTYDRKVNVREKVYNNIIEVYNKKDLNSPLIEIRADNITRKYNVKSNSKDFIDIDLGIESAFKIWIINNNGDIKAAVNLLGNDTADSSKLDAINRATYGDGDYIKVWRNPSETLQVLLINH